jgi:hypothetical protein
MITLFFFVLGMILAAIHIFRKPVNPQEKHKKLEIILMYYIVFAIGVTGLFAAYGHIFMANQIAQDIGWPTGSPFQTEVAFANLAFGVLGILCIWIRGKFWLATIIGSGVFLFADGIGHIIQIVNNHDYAPDNAGMILYTDLIFPILGLILYFFYDLQLRKAQKQTN